MYEDMTMMCDQKTAADLNPDDVLARWIEGLYLGAPMMRGALTLVPVYSESAPVLVDYEILCEAITNRAVIIEEMLEADMRLLQVRNLGDRPVLIFDGEQVIGGNQNRVANSSLLVPPRATFDLPVTCVERGRWRDRGDEFRSGEAIYPTLRQRKMTQISRAFAVFRQVDCDHDTIWNEIEARQRHIGVRSGTSAVDDTYAYYNGFLAEVERNLPFPEDNPIGVIGLISGTAYCADLFGQPTTLGGYWSRLVRSYALEAVHASPALPFLEAAQHFIRRPLAARQTTYSSCGLGFDIRIDGGDLVGSALVHEGQIIHTGLFAKRQEIHYDDLEPSYSARAYQDIAELYRIWSRN